MRKGIVLLLLGLVFLTFGCSTDTPNPVTPAMDGRLGSSPDAQAQAWTLVERAGWPVEASTEGFDPAGLTAGGVSLPSLLDFQRTVIAGDIVHYSAVVTTGPGMYDRIGVHRVVREERPNVPIRTKTALFMLHGDLKRFETMFIPGRFSPELDDDFGIAVYLARNGVDVWGIDQAWNFVPREETDFSFFADWGLQREVDHLAVGLRIARTARLLTGNGNDQMLLLGYSSGAVTGYALLNEETQLPPGHRQVKGYIAADFGVRSDDPDWLAQGQGWLEQYEQLYAAGQYEDPIYIFQDVAMLARTDPGSDSPFFPGLTNMQVALFFGGGEVWPPSKGHYHAPIIEDGLPVDFQFITIGQWLDFITASACYEPTLFELDYTRLMAGQTTPFVEHLGEIRVPVLHLGGAGGIAPYTTATLSYLGSTDISQHIVSVGAPDPALDYGHVDIFTASNAPTLVWQPVLEWVQQHSRGGRR
jgi:hypothetical protein